jgi:ribonuclease Z
MMKTKTGFRISSVFITHLHTDHFIGSFGLLETMSLNGREEPITFYAPNADFLRNLFKMFGYEHLGFPVRVIELKDGDVVDFGEFRVVAFETDHIVKSLGYALIEKDRRGKFDRKKAEELGIPPGPLYAKLASGESIVWNGEVITPDMVLGEARRGRKIVYTGDTRPCERTIRIAKNADVLIHDASFTSDLQEWAEETKHSTAKEAAEIARLAGVRQLILTHISARYSKDSKPLLDDARATFKNVIVAEDFMSLEVEFKD